MEKPKLDKVFVRVNGNWEINEYAPRNSLIYERVGEMRADVIDRIQNDKYSSEMFLLELYIFWVLCDEYLDGQCHWQFDELNNYFINDMEDDERLDL
jgi:hypothetical protein